MHVCPLMEQCIVLLTVHITFIFIDFRVCDFAFAFKTQNAPFYYQTDFNLRFKRKRDVRLTCKRVWCILHRTLSIQWLCISFWMKLNPPNAHRSQIKICEKRQTRNVQFRFMPNAYRILKPIQKSSKCVWVFRNTGANAVAKNQRGLAYEDKRDLYCIYL